MSAQKTRAGLLIILVFSLGLAANWMRGADKDGSVSGIVKMASGEPAVGALVRLKNPERGISFTVASQEQGRYRIANLPPGKYTVEAIGGAFRSNPGEAVTVPPAEAATADLALTVRQSWQEAMTNSQMVELLPEPNSKDSETKLFILAQCTQCHRNGLAPIVGGRRNRDEWHAVVEKMRNRPSGSGYSLRITDQERDTVVNYLAKHLGPDRPPVDEDREVAKNWVKGDASKFVITEFDLPSGARPHDVAVDSKGIGWVGEEALGMLDRVDPESLTLSRISIPKGTRRVEDAHTVVVDPQDRVWVAGEENNRMVQYDPKTQEFTFYPHDGLGVHDVVFHPDGNVWMTNLDDSKILKLDPVTKKFTEFGVPSAVRSGGHAGAYGMAVAGDNFLWFSERDTNLVGRVEPKSGEITEYEVPAPKGMLKRMATDPEGNIWLGGYGGVGNLIKIDHRTAKMTLHPTPTKYSAPYSVGVDMKRNLIWVSEFLGNRLARYDPKANRFVEYPLFRRDTQIRSIAVDPGKPNRVWFCGNNVDSVGYLEGLE